MEIGLVGFGRMGQGLARRLTAGGVGVVVHDRDPRQAETARAQGMAFAPDLPGLAARLAPPRVVWLMVPHDAVDATLAALLPALEAGDTVVDGGNADYRESRRRFEELARRGVAFADVGVSGGVHGARDGYCLMAGGDEAVLRRLEPLFALLAAPGGYRRVGPAGAGHFVKMVHNGIEYGLLEAYAEGFALLAARRDLGVDAAAVAELWRHGSVVRSWLLELAAGALASDPELASVGAVVADSGEGRWTVREGLELGVPLPAITAALHARFASQGNAAFAARFVARLRHAFGGHPVVPEGSSRDPVSG